jgi:hypothetical protein
VGSHIIVSVEKITTYRRVFTTIEAEGNFFKPAKPHQKIILKKVKTLKTASSVRILLQ